MACARPLGFHPSRRNEGTPLCHAHQTARPTLSRARAPVRAADTTTLASAPQAAAAAAPSRAVAPAELPDPVPPYRIVPGVKLKAKPPPWVLPVAGYHLTGRFGASSEVWSSTHTGLDFAASEGPRSVPSAPGSSPRPPTTAPSATRPSCASTTAWSCGTATRVISASSSASEWLPVTSSGTSAPLAASPARTSSSRCTRVTANRSTPRAGWPSTTCLPDRRPPGATRGPFLVPDDRGPWSLVRG